LVTELSITGETTFSATGLQSENAITIAAMNFTGFAAILINPRTTPIIAPSTIIAQRIKSIIMFKVIKAPSLFNYNIVF
jgi:hypothetical protein